MPSPPATPQNFVAFGISPGSPWYSSWNALIACRYLETSETTALSCDSRISAVPTKIPPTRRPMITSTIASSTRVNPDLLFLESLSPYWSKCDVMLQTMKRQTWEKASPILVPSRIGLWRLVGDEVLTCSDI